MDMATRRPRAVYSAPALEKGLDILEALAETGKPQSLSALAHTLDRSSSELFRPINSLEKRGYVIKDSLSGRYLLSLKLYELAHIHPPVEQLLRAAVEPMRKLAHSLRQSCHLSVLSRGKLLVLVEAGSPEKIRLSISVGSRFSALLTASGRLLLAGLPDEDRRQFLKKDPDYRRMGAVQKKKILAALRKIRESGYSTADNETYMGIRDLAVPAGNSRAGVSAALDVTFWIVPRKRFEVRTVLSSLRGCAESITRAMGVAQP